MSVTLTGTGSVTLPDPEYGDSDFYDVKNVVNRSRGGKIIVLYPSRTAQRRRTLTWRHMSSTEITNLQTFLLANLGAQVTYAGHRGESETVMVLTPDANIAVEGREMCAARRSITLELEVIL